MRVTTVFNKLLDLHGAFVRGVAFSPTGIVGLNNKIGVIKHRAYGFHSFAALAAMVFLCCTDLRFDLPV